MTALTANRPKWTVPEIMLAVLFLLAPLYYHPNLGGEGLRLPHNITIWLVATIFIAYSFLKILKVREYIIPKYFWMIAAFPVLATLSGFIAGVEQPLKWLFRLLFIWGGLAFFFALFQARLSQARIDRLLYLVVLSALIFAVVGILQILLKLDMPYLLPKNPDGIPGSFFQQINNMATYQVTAIMIALYLSTRPAFKHFNLKALILTITTLLAAFIVGVSGSRIGALALIIGLLVVLPVILRTQFKAKWRFALLAAIALGFVAGINFSNDRMINKTEAIQSGYSGEARLGMYSISLGLIAESPFVGQGIGSFGPAWQFAKPAFYAENPDAKLPKQYVSHPHNELIQWLVEGGIVAFVGLLLVVAGVLLAAQKSLSGKRAALYAGMLLPIALHTQVEIPFYLSALHWLVFITLLFVVMRHQLSTRQITITLSANRLLTVFIWIFSGLLLWFYVHTLLANRDFLDYYAGNHGETVLPYAYKNPYLGEQARWIDLSAIMYSAIERNQQEPVRYYIQWGAALKAKHPDVDLYIKLVDAYEFLQNRQGYCETAAEGLAIYPEAGRLQNAVEFCKY